MEGSDGYPASLQMKEAIENEYESLKPLFEKHPEIFPPEVGLSYRVTLLCSTLLYIALAIALALALALTPLTKLTTLALES